MQTNILITGGTSMVGKHLKKMLPDAIYIGSKDYDLRNPIEVEKMYMYYRPHTVIHLAAKVGGIMDNISNPVGFFEDNILINTNTIQYAYKYNVQRFIGILSTCIYPDVLPEECYPLTEIKLHDGPPTQTNFAYGYAKRCLAVQIDAYNKQYGTKYNYLIPTNLYSEVDHFEGNKSHFVSSLIHKITTAKLQGKDHITLFGTGAPLRQFMYGEDLAKAIHLCIINNITQSFNVCNNENFSIKTIAHIALEACNANNLQIKWDTTKPDGQFRKDASNEKFKQLFPDFVFTSLKDGIRLTYDYYHKKMAS